MLIKKPSDIPSSEITPESVFLNRRQFVGAAASLALAASAAPVVRGGGRLAGQQAQDFSDATDELGDEVNSYEEITTYNNFYEFGTDKRDPSKNAHTLTTRPWSIAVEGHVNKPGTYALEDFFAPHRMEDRIYRLRCVEAWSMVVPWRGVRLGDVIKRFEPTGSARFVEFTTLVRPEEMVGQRRPILDWPYVEGLRMDEAMHPLTMLVTGVYGRDLPNQNGAPTRLVVPWKYGFKGIKSIVKMRFVERQPLNTWQAQAPNEYGFYANVNPEVDHPRWSQARERRIGELRRRPTLMLNGYADQVGQLYAGMDPKKLY